MYKHSDIMFFNEDEQCIKSLTPRSNKRVICVCPFCKKQRPVTFSNANRTGTTVCRSCSLKNNTFSLISGKRFGRLLVLSQVIEKAGSQSVLCMCDCGRQVVVRVSNLKSGDTRSCGCLHKETMSSMVGPLHPRYDCSITDEQRKVLKNKRCDSKSYYFRKAVKERDNNMCVICDSTKNLVVHHLENFKNNELLRYEVSNGVTLCRACHQEFHTVFLGGYQIPCTEQDFNDYVSQI